MAGFLPQGTPAAAAASRYQTVCAPRAQEAGAASIFGDDKPAATACTLPCPPATTMTVQAR